MLNYTPRLSFLSILCAGTTLVGATGEQNEAGLNEKLAEILPQISAYANEAVERTNLPGLVLAVVQGDEVILMETIGTRKVGEDLPVTPNTVFQFASLSKPTTSSLVAAVVGKNLIQFSDPVSQYEVGLVMNDAWLTSHVQVDDLLSHRSGLPDHAGDYLEDLGYPVEMILERVGLLEPLYPFRDGYAYTNFGFTAGGLAAANAVGLPFEELAEQFLFEPLGMAQSSFRFTDFQNAEERAYTHVQTSDGVWEAKFVREPDAQAPAGGLSTTVSDFSRWMRMIVNGGEFEGKQIVEKEALVETWRPHSQTGFNPTTYHAHFYGMGWNVSHTGLGLRLSHSGAFALGTRTAVYLYPDQKLGIVTATNGGGHGIPEAMGMIFDDLLLRGEVQRDWIGFANENYVMMEAETFEYEVDLATAPADPGPAGDLADYVGEFSNDYFGVVQVADNEGVLTLTIGPKPAVFELSHWDGDTFLFQPMGENAGGPGAVEFQRADDGVVSSIFVPFFNVNGSGTFLRQE